MHFTSKFDQKHVCKVSGMYNFLRSEVFQKFPRILYFYNIKLAEMSLKRKQCFIPAREISWKKYAYLQNRENNIYYDCQCGKRFISFPAIYLHFQRKHNRKLGTKHRPQEFQVRRNEKELIYFYFVQIKRLYYGRSKIVNETKQGQSSEENLLHRVFSQFLWQNKVSLQKLYKFSYFEQVLLSLSAFIHIKHHETTKTWELDGQVIQILPLHFNDFVMHEVRQGKFRKKRNYPIFCSSLLMLCKWLKEKGYTTIELEFDSDLKQSRIE